MKTNPFLAPVFFILIFVLSPHSSFAQPETIRTYWIGNSLTNDIVKFGGFENLAVLSGISYVASQHVQCSTSLSGVLATANKYPDTNHTCAASRSNAGANYDLGSFPNAFDHQIDVLIIQPFQNATLREEVVATKSIIDLLRKNPINKETRVVIYQTWDRRRSSKNYLTDWNEHVTQMDDEFRPCKNTYERYFRALTNAGYEFDVIPTGQAFADVSAHLLNDKLGNISDTRDLFRDFIHAGNAGRYLGTLIANQVLTGMSPVKVAKADTFRAFSAPNRGLVANADASEALKRIAHDTVSSMAPPRVLHKNRSDENGVAE